MAKPNVTDILYRFVGDSKSLQNASKKGQSGLSSIVGMAGKAAAGLGLAFGGREVVQWAADAVQMAVAAEEVDSKFEAVFGTAQELNDALREWGDVAGITETKAKDMAATFGNLAMAQGVSAAETEKLVLQVATMAGDMASFNDSDPADVFFDLNKALLTTEREGMKKYGIAISEVEVKTRALEIATADGRTEATQADRAFASYEIALRQTGKAQGDLQRTSKSVANRQRQLSASVQELQEEIGRELLPVYEDLLSLTIKLAPAMKAVTVPVKLLAQDVDEGASNWERYGNFIGAMIPGLDIVGGTIADLAGHTADLTIETEKGAQAIIEEQIALDLFAHAAKGADEATQDFSDAQKRVADAAGQWIRILGDIAGAYNRVAEAAAAAAFLAPGGGIDEDRVDDAFNNPGESISNALEYNDRINGQ